MSAYVSSTLPGMEEMHIPLVARECQCGCGTSFFQTRVGRPKLYVNAEHKRRAARERARNRRQTGRIGECVTSMLDWYEHLDVQEGQLSFSWLDHDESAALLMLYDCPDRETLARGLSKLAERYCGE